jgi:hypothetical protein
VDPDLLALELSSERDPDGSRLRQALGAHVALQRARASRMVLVHVLAAAGLPVWLMALWPRWASGEARRLVLVLWAWSALMAVVALVRERRWRWRRDAQAPAGTGIPEKPLL